MLLNKYRILYQGYTCTGIAFLLLSVFIYLKKTGVHCS
ncbi:hypothetical protein FLA_3349 [Filimonas lacunae]|nr:hypothetical protein FLA_3349 [Filimonas lacunae]